MTYACQVTIHPESFKISATKNDCAEVLVDGLVKCLGGGKVRVELFWGIWVFSISIHSRLKKCESQ